MSLNNEQLAKGFLEAERMLGLYVEAGKTNPGDEYKSDPPEDGEMYVVRSSKSSSIVRNMLYGGRNYKHPIEYHKELKAQNKDNE